MAAEKPVKGTTEEPVESAAEEQIQDSAEEPVMDPHPRSIPDALPVLPLRGGTVVFPLAVVPLLVGQERSIRMVDDVMRGNRMLALVAQRGGEPQQPGPDDLYTVGTAAIIHQLARCPTARCGLIVQGLERVRLLDFVSDRAVSSWPGWRRRRTRSTGSTRPKGCGAPCSISSGARGAFPRGAGRSVPRRETVTDPRQVAYLVASTAPIASDGPAGDPRAGAGRGQAAPLVELSSTRSRCASWGSRSPPRRRAG